MSIPIVPTAIARVITTETDMAALAERTVVRDRNGDVFEKVGPRAVEMTGQSGRWGLTWVAYPATVIFEPSYATEHIDPDCRGDKHPACPGWTWADDLDKTTPCECACHDPEETQQ